MSELSSESGVPVASIKFYLREGLLAPGEKTGATQSSYDGGHVARLRLIRALIDAGGLTVATARSVLAAIDDPGMPIDDVLGHAQRAVPDPPTEPSPRSVDRIRALMHEQGWRAWDGNPGITQAAGVLDALDRIGREDVGALLEPFADAAGRIAEADLDLVATSGDRARMAETVVVGTVLGDRLLAGLRRIAQESASHSRYSPADALPPTSLPDRTDPCS